MTAASVEDPVGRGGGSTSGAGAGGWQRLHKKVTSPAELKGQNVCIGGGEGRLFQGDECHEHKPRQEMARSRKKWNTGMRG